MSASFLNPQRPRSADPDFWDVWTLAAERPVEWRTIARDWSGDEWVEPLALGWAQLPSKFGKPSRAVDSLLFTDRAANSRSILRMAAGATTFCPARGLSRR
jgi:hypothetical protein